MQILKLLSMFLLGASIGGPGFIVILNFVSFSDVMGYCVVVLFCCIDVLYEICISLFLFCLL